MWITILGLQFINLGREIRDVEDSSIVRIIVRLIQKSKHSILLLLELFKQRLSTEIVINETRFEAFNQITYYSWDSHQF